MKLTERMTAVGVYLLGVDIIKKQTVYEQRIAFSRSRGRMDVMPSYLGWEGSLKAYGSRCLLVVQWPATLAVRLSGLELLTRPLRRSSTAVEPQAPDDITRHRAIRENLVRPGE